MENRAILAKEGSLGMNPMRKNKTNLVRIQIFAGFLADS